MSEEIICTLVCDDDMVNAKICKDTNVNVNICSDDELNTSIDNVIVTKVVTSDHTQLTNRDVANQHPISSITGLQELFNSKKLDELQLTKLEDYLYSLHYNPDQMDYQKALTYLYETYHPNINNNLLNITKPRIRLGSCSSIRKGNFFGRNYDWYYSENVSFVIRKEGGKGKYSSIGMLGGGFPKINKETIERREYSEIYDILPFVLVDGINEKGVTVSINVVPVNDGMGKTTGTHPELPGDELCMLQVPSYILDNFSSASAAVAWIRDEAKIYGMYNDEVQEELHILIADENETYLVEFINNQAVIYNNKYFITNFYLTRVTFNADGTPNWNTITPHGQGVERYEIINNNYNNINSSSSMRNMLNMIKYTKAYDIDPINEWWKTEFAGDYTDIPPISRDLTITTPLEVYESTGLVNIIENLFEHRTRDGVSTWQTVHSSVYDISKRQFTLIVQEEEINKEKTFQLFPTTAVEDKFFVHEQNVAASIWLIHHNLDKYPSITIVDNNENTIEGTIEYIDNSNIKVTFNAIFRGRAYLN